MLQIQDAMKVILAGNDRKLVMDDIGITTPLISSWLTSKDRIIGFDKAALIYGNYDIVVWPYDEIALIDRWRSYDKAK